MFRNKLTSYLIPQFEHARLAGHLAGTWGNANFDTPNLPRESFVTGVLFHDRGFGFLDRQELGAVSEPERASMFRRTVRSSFRDPVAEIVILMHVRRLLDGNSNAEHQSVFAEAERAIEKALSDCGYDQSQFSWADQITDLCDRIAFDFAFGTLTEGHVSVRRDEESQEFSPIQYKIIDGGVIEVKPWPFGVDIVRGEIVGYIDEGYPDLLEPKVLSYTVRNAEG